ncbi:hypothetical protein I5P84_05500 [Pseudomonas mosselii]|uniref:hypothetical protein n=1 Tax=Pseudomonas mosselii TaxID=78327 RepID=UPI0018D91062|nr:hypothetical protein [Pseudomonas mosselii]MBH3308909.1 hypothetical protein [Pseudomonas mosselii]MBH3325319.1 hypothetical protein [Pseudomonas mosselii]
MQLESGSHKHLAQTYIFWLALGVPLIASAILAACISMATDLGQLCLESTCVQNFFDIFKFPIAIAGLSLPLVAMVAAIHRSIEASTQINIAIKQYGEAIANNRFGNYLKHREGFEKLIDSLCARRNLDETSKLYLVNATVYSRVFPDASLKNEGWAGQFNSEWVNELRYNWVRLEAQLKSNSGYDLEVIVESVSVIAKALTINYTKSMRMDAKFGGKEIVMWIPKMDNLEDSMYAVLKDIFFVIDIITGYAQMPRFLNYSIGAAHARVFEVFSNQNANLAL